MMRKNKVNIKDLENMKELQLYVHIPFCAKKCGYCDFVSMVLKEESQRPYVDQLIDEIRSQGRQYSDYYISTIYIGGGTPTLLKGTWIVNIMSAIYESFLVAASAEITIECNPGTVSVDKLKYYRQSGINRISIGLQSTVNEELKKLGRIHTFEDFLECFQMVREAGFTNTNVDLMSAIPNQTPATYKESLRRIVRLKPEHISVYSLILEPDTPFYRHYHNNAKNREELADEDTERRMYHLARKYLTEHGYEQYEISNYAKPGYECRHNYGYWTGAEYLGLGLGAHSYVLGKRFHVEKSLPKYMKILMKKDLTSCYQDIEDVDKAAGMEEFFFLGLRLTKGVNLEKFQEKFGEDPFVRCAVPIGKHIQLGLLEYKEPYLFLTEKGLDFANYVMSDFLGL